MPRFPHIAKLLLTGLLALMASTAVNAHPSNDDGAPPNPNVKANVDTDKSRLTRSQLFRSWR